MSGGRSKPTNGLGALQLFTLAFGVAVGVGWIVVLGDWLRVAGPFGGALAFGVAAVLMLAIGKTYASLALEFPVAGGEFTYARLMFNPVVAFWLGWFLALAYIAVMAFEMVSLAWIVRGIFPALLPPAQSSSGNLAGLALGIAALLLVLLLSARGSRSSARAQDMMVILKVLISAVLIAGALLGGSVANLQPVWGAHPDGALAGIAAVFASAPFFFAGFGAIAQAIADVKSPSSMRAMPFVIGGVILGTGAFYALMIVAASAAAPRSVTLGANLPAVAAFSNAFGTPSIGRLVLLLGLLGVLTTINGVYFACVRLVGAMASSGLLPTVFGRTNDRGAPVTAGVVVGAVAAGLALAGPTAINPFLNVSSASIAAVMGFACTALVKLARRRGQSILVAALGAVLSAAMVIAPLVQPGQTNGFPFECVIVLGWGGAGALLWVLQRPYGSQGGDAAPDGTAPAQGATDSNIGESEVRRRASA